MEEFEKYSDIIAAQLIVYGPKVLLAIVVLVIGLWLIKLFNNGFIRLMSRRNIDVTLRPFLQSLISLILKILLIISVAAMVGIETTSFIAMIGAAGLAIGLALQGSLANFAGGILILLFKPFTVGDVIEAQGYIGKVKEIQIFYTILNTGDNKTIIIPNGKLSNDSLTNFTKEANRRVDMEFSISYSDNIDKARQIIREIINSDERIFHDPEPFLVVSKLADNAVIITVRVWSSGADYWNIFFSMQEKVKKAFDTAGISIPFPQRQIHVVREETDRKIV
jgi:small conductance mechanosensitive channel